MSPLTKVLVVLVTILSVLELGLFVAYSSKHAQLNDKLKAETDARKTAQTLANVNQAELDAATANLSSTIAGLNSKINTLTADLTSANTARSAAEVQVQEEKARNAETGQAIAHLTASAAQDAELREALIEELKSARDEVVSLRTKNVELSDANNELSSALASIERNLRYSAEELVAAKEKNDQLEKTLTDAGIQVASAETVSKSAPVPDPAISGQITQVDASSDTTLVAVNVGANDGVARGMEFMVHRDNAYVGKLVIDSVDSDVSAGYMVLTQGQVQADDMVYAGPY